MKHGIRPPRKPRGEDLSVTVANQDKQIKMLIDRCATLTAERDQAYAAADDAQHSANDTDQQLSNIEAAFTRLQGWQDCARELLGGNHALRNHWLDPFTSNTMGP